MKKIFLLLSLLLLTLLSYAGGDKKQKSDYPKIKLGVEGGLNFATIFYNNPTPSLSPNELTLAWHAGAYSQIEFNDKLNFQPELLYSVKGEKLFTNIIHLNYVEIPLELKYNIGRQYFIIVGPYIGFFINLTSNETTTLYSNSKNNSPAQNLLDMGAVIGIEHQWANGFNIGLKYTPGFYDIFPNTIPGYPNDVLVPGYNMDISLYVGWTFIKFSGNR